MVAGVSLAILDCGSIRGSQPRSQSDHAKCGGASDLGTHGIAPAHQQRYRGILKFIRIFREVKPTINAPPNTACTDWWESPRFQAVCVA